MQPNRTASLATKLLAYLRQQLDNNTIELQSPLAQITGGQEAEIYRLQLTSSDNVLPQPLVLRIYPSFRDPRKVIYEQTIQNTLFEQNYPTPKVHLACTDSTVLGGGFLIMDLLPGEMMFTVAGAQLPWLLGRSHAQLHQIDTLRLQEALIAQGFDRQHFHWSSRLRWINSQRQQLPWLAESLDWLIEHHPQDPPQLAICHGDFHPLNLLMVGDWVSGVLDWSGCTFGDPVMDVAFTVTLFESAAQQAMPNLDWQAIIAAYLDAYRSVNPLSLERLDYYCVLRAVAAFVEGATGQAVWRTPAIMQKLAALIYNRAGLSITLPDESIS